MTANKLRRRYRVWSLFCPEKRQNIVKGIKFQWEFLVLYQRPNGNFSYFFHNPHHHRHDYAKVKEACSFFLLSLIFCYHTECSGKDIALHFKRVNGCHHSGLKWRYQLSKETRRRITIT